MFDAIEFRDTSLCLCSCGVCLRVRLCVFVYFNQKQCNGITQTYVKCNERLQIHISNCLYARIQSSTLFAFYVFIIPKPLHSIRFFFVFFFLPPSSNHQLSPSFIPVLLKNRAFSNLFLPN